MDLGFQVPFVVFPLYVLHILAKFFGQFHGIANSVLKFLFRGIKMILFPARPRTKKKYWRRLPVILSLVLQNRWLAPPEEGADLRRYLVRAEDKEGIAGSEDFCVIGDRHHGVVPPQAIVCDTMPLL